MTLDELARTHAPVATSWAFAGAILAVGLWESASPLRGARSGTLRRWLVHFGLGAANAALQRALVPVVALGVAIAAAEREAGLLRLLDLPWPVAFALWLAAADLGEYLCHRAWHSASLWPVHRVHHSDAGVDLTTSLRSHPLQELGLAAARLVLVGALGPPIAAVACYELLAAASGFFTHANASLPARVERIARLVLVTPDLHRIHHSADAADASSNFSGVFSIWDRLFGTWRAEPAAGRAALRLGDAAVPDAEHHGVIRLLAQPFTASPPAAGA
jgi:sterol desaturase/sphingolipid hydroxylase (fatty acid hydroxylase superfamily)